MADSEARNFQMIKQALPNWPEDVILQWLLPLSLRGDTGWPPPDPLGDHAWYYILSRKPLDWWAQVNWSLQRHKFTLANLCSRDKEMTIKMISAYFGNEINEYSVIRTGRERVSSAFRYLAEHREFPKPIIAMKLSDGFRVVDGSHRVAAFVSFSKLSKVDLKTAGLRSLRPFQSIWVGTHPSNDEML